MRYLIVMCLMFWISACAAHDERYYMLHPNALQQVISQCPEKQPAHVSCEQLEKIAGQMNEFALQVRASPQDFGKRILALQEQIAKQELALQSNTSQPKLRSAIEQNKYELEVRLAVVRWLESPESR